MPLPPCRDDASHDTARDCQPAVRPSAGTDCLLPALVRISCLFQVPLQPRAEPCGKLQLTFCVLYMLFLTAHILPRSDEMKWTSERSPS